MDDDTGKRCAKCGEWKAWSEFSPQGPHRTRRKCKACEREYQRQAREANPERYRERKRKAQRRYSAAHPEYRERQKQRWIQLRETVFDHYGRVCACCGATNDLSIDHPDGDGSAHRIGLFGSPNAAGTRMYLWLVREGFPDGFQVLCLPCNRSKSNGAVCRMHKVPEYGAPPHCLTCTCQD